VLPAPQINDEISRVPSFPELRKPNCGLYLNDPNARTSATEIAALVKLLPVALLAAFRTPRCSSKPSRVRCFAVRLVIQGNLMGPRCTAASKVQHPRVAGCPAQAAVCRRLYGLSGCY